jgi:hypothetical protein
MTAPGGAHRVRRINLAGSQERRCGTDKGGVAFRGQLSLSRVIDRYIYRAQAPIMLRPPYSLRQQTSAVLFSRNRLRLT